MGQGSLVGNVQCCCSGVCVCETVYGGGLCMEMYNAVVVNLWSSSAGGPVHM